MRSSSVRLLAFLSVPAGLAAFIQVASAQQPIELSPITVQGATLAAPPRRPGPASDGTSTPPVATDTTGGDTIAGMPAYTIGNAVSVVTGEELRAQQVRTAAEALRSLPGVAVGR